MINSNSSSPVLIPDDDGSTTDDLTDFGSEVSSCSLASHLVLGDIVFQSHGT